VFYVHEQYGPQLHDKVRQITSAPGFFRSLPLIEGGDVAIHSLMNSGHDVLICTSPLTASSTCMQEKYDWVRHYFGQKMASNMVITKDKTMVRGDILIDDRPEVRGRFEPNWEHILFHAPYNAAVANRRRLNRWVDVITMIDQTSQAAH
jgi:5'-nucleotidase